MLASLSLDPAAPVILRLIPTNLSCSWAVRSHVPAGKEITITYLVSRNSSIRAAELPFSLADCRLSCRGWQKCRRCTFIFLKRLKAERFPQRPLICRKPCLAAPLSDRWRQTRGGCTQERLRQVSDSYISALLPCSERNIEQNTDNISRFRACMGRLDSNYQQTLNALLALRLCCNCGEMYFFPYLFLTFV